MKELTKAEEQVMQILWDLKKGFVNDIINKLPEPKPAYNTISTIVRILEKKGFVDHTAYGKTHEYYPIVSKEGYTREYFNGFLNRYFSNSFKQLVSFFSQENKLTVKEMEEIMKIMNDQIQQQKIEKK